MTVRAIARLVHYTLVLSSSYSLDSRLSILNLFCIQPSSRFDELPDDFDPSGRPGSFDDGDPQTTNLYVGNLSPKVFFLFLLGSYVVFSRHCILNIHKV